MLNTYLSGRLFLGLSILLFYNSSCQAQDSLKLQEKPFCITSMAHQPRPTFFSFKRYRSAGYLARQADGSTLAIEDNSSIEINLRIPLVLTPGFKMLGSFTYYDEDFEFVQHKEEETLPHILHNKSLRSFNTSLYTIIPFRGSLFLTNRLQASLNGDYFRAYKNRYLNYSFASVLGWKKSDNTILGAGLMYSMDFDGGSFVPLLAYQHVFNPHWSVDILLPAKLSLQHYSPNSRNVMSAHVRLNGLEYNIGLNLPPGPVHQYFFQRNEIRWSLSLEHEIHDWLWIGAEAGINTPLSSDWLEVSNSVNKPFETSFQPNFFTTLSLFMVVPQSLIK